MKFLQFTAPGTNGLRVGYLDGDKVVDINSADPQLPSTLLGLLSSGSIDKVSR